MTSSSSSLFAHRTGSKAAPLANALDQALATGDLGQLPVLEPANDFDEVASLLAIYELWLAPLPGLGERARWQNHPLIAGLKWRLEERFLAQLEVWSHPSLVPVDDPAVALRRIARRDRPEIYEWVATSADWAELVRFLAIEGGPDGGFDDLVAICQVGIQGEAKVVLGANYWDEMGRGHPTEVHTALHERLVAAIDMPRIPYEDLPVSALYRTALNGLLATNRWLQPEMLGALGLLELQAGPRCRQVLRGLQRLGAPAEALPFYEEHADTDPRHGKEWLDGALRPICDEHPDWAPRIVRGARWRAEVNHRLFTDALQLIVGGSLETVGMHTAS